MKNAMFYLILLVASLATEALYAQHTFNYQGVLRDADAKLMGNATIDFRFRLLPDMYSISGYEYEEVHELVKTNSFGVFVIEFGNQKPKEFMALDFSTPYLFEVSLRNPGDADFQLLHRSPMAATAYAMHAMTAEQVDDADADPTNEMQSLSFDATKNTLSISGGNEITIPTGGSDADADPENELQLLDYDEDSHSLSISGGNTISLPMGGGADEDQDAENELQQISLLGNGNLLLSHGGGQVKLNQSPLVPTTTTNGDFAYKLLRPLAIGKNRPQAGFNLDVDGNLKTNKLYTNNIQAPGNQQSIHQLFIRGAQGAHIASFTGAKGSAESNLYVDELRIGRGRIRLHSQKGFDGEFWVSEVGRSEKLLRIGAATSAITSKNFYVSNHMQIYHPNSSNGQTGLRILNIGGKGNYWNLYTSNTNGNLEFWFKGAIKARIASSDGAYVRNSDRRLKENIRPIESVLASVIQLDAKRYTFKQDSTKQENIGFITQEIMELFPEIVRTGADGFQGLNYQDFAVLAIKAIQEQQAIIDQQQSELQMLSTEVAEIKNILTGTVSKP